MWIRDATAHDLPILYDALLEAFNWTGERRFTFDQMTSDPTRFDT